MALELHTEDRLVYQFYPVTSNFVSFKIKAPNDAHIALTSTPYESNPMYEVFFGGWGNTKSVIRKNQQKPDVVEVPTPNILDANNHKGFWIRWDYGTITAGAEGDPRPILSWQDSQMFPIQYFGVCTGWGARGHWIIENSPAPVNPTTAPGYPAVPGYPAAPGYPGAPGFPAPPAVPPAAFSYPTPGFNPQVTSPYGEPIPPAGLGFGAPTSAPKWLPCSNGSVPPNAVVAGADVSGELIYVARAPHEGAVIPGKLVPSHKVAYVAWGGRENPKSDYEVLCDCSPRWIPTSGQQVPPGAFPAGQAENGETLYVGRSQHEGSTTPGKVQASHGVCYIPFGGQEIAKQQYEVLAL